MLIRSDDRFIFLSKTGVIRYVGTFGDYLDSLVLNMGAMGAMGINGAPGVDGSSGVASYFEAYPSVPSVLNGGSISVIAFDTLLHELNSPGFNVTTFSHLPSPEVYQELWHYSIAIHKNNIAELWAILRHRTSQVEVKRVKLVQDLQVTLNAYHVWTQGDTDPLEVCMFTPAGDATLNWSGEVWWQGARIADLVVDAPPQQFTFDGQVDRGEDDAHETDASTSFSHTAVTMRVEPNADAASRWNCAFLVRNVTIPQGATVTEAYAEVVFPVNQRDSPRLTVYGNLVPSALDFQASQMVTGRVRTSASVGWVGDDFGAGMFVQTPSLIPIIQELVNQPGWVSGNNIALIFVADTSGPEATRFSPFDNAPLDACKLHIVATT